MWPALYVRCGSCDQTSSNPCVRHITGVTNSHSRKLATPDLESVM